MVQPYRLWHHGPIASAEQDQGAQHLWPCFCGGAALTGRSCQNFANGLADSMHM